MGLAIHDLTGDAAAAIAAASLPLIIGLTNLMPFAAAALPVAALTWALAAHHLRPPAEAPGPDAPHVLADTAR